MRGTKAKRLRNLGLKSGPAERVERPPRTTDLPGWIRTSMPPLPNPTIEARAEAKRARRRQRNLDEGLDLRHA